MRLPSVELAPALCSMIAWPPLGASPRLTSAHLASPRLTSQRLFDALVAGCVVYVLIAMPIKVTWRVQPLPEVDLLVDIVFLLDIVLQLLHGYFDRELAHASCWNETLQPGRLASTCVPCPRLGRSPTDPCVEAVGSVPALRWPPRKRSADLG